MSEERILNKIGRVVSTFLMALAVGAATWFSWFCIIMFGTGTSSKIEVALLYSIGIPLSAGAGVLLSILQKGEFSPVAALVGWLASLPLNVVSFVFGNPANSDSSNKPLLIVLLALVALIGPLSAVIASRNNVRLLRALAVITGLTTVGYTAAVVLVAQ